MPNNSHIIRVLHDTYCRLRQLQAKMLVVKEKGQGYDNVPLVEQGERGVWVSFDAVIARALDEFESHRKRSNPGNNKKTQ